MGLFATTGTLDRFPVSYLLLAIVGLVYARRYRMGAGLFVMVGGLLTASSYMEPGMYLVSGLGTRLLFGDGMLGLFWVLIPVAVLRARSVLGQALGLLLPAGAYTAACVFALSSASGLLQHWFQFTLSQSLSVANPFIVLFATAAIAGFIYAWVSTWDFTAGGMRRWGRYEQAGTP